MRTKPIDEVIAQQVRFSSRAFGPGPRTEGLLQHIRKELDEIRQDPLDVLEWIDVVILGLDGAWRAASTQHPWLNDADVAKFVADALLYKIGVNMERDWPDWREVGQDQPIEHVKRDDRGITTSPGAAEHDEAHRIAEAALEQRDEARRRAEAALEQRDEAQRRAEAAERERDAMERRARAYEAGAEKLQAERDALAARVEDKRT